jgi:hypothetical protein
MSDDLPRPPRMPPINQEPDGKPEWDQDDADFLIGKYVLVGMTHVAPDGTVTSQEQFHGRVTKAEQNVGITLACEGTRAGETVVLPPHPTAFQLAGPSRYTLRSTGEVIEDPDMTTSWTVHAPPRS